MDNIKKYILRYFISSFINIFFTLYFIASLIFFIKIAKITSFIQINFIELIQLYTFILPNIFLYTLPISFFISIGIALNRLSKENELIVLFSLGFNSDNLKKIFLKLSIIVSFILLIIAIFGIPLAKSLNVSFIEFKKTEAKFNIKASELGQKFSDWFVFVPQISQENKYENIVLFKIDDSDINYNQNNNKSNENLILAKESQIINNNGIFGLELKDGKSYVFDKEKIILNSFERLNIIIPPSEVTGKFDSILLYWKNAFDKKDKSSTPFLNLIISFFPLCSYMIAITFGISHSRYQKSYFYVYAFGTILIYYIMAYMLSINFNLLSFLAFLIIFYLIAAFIFKKYVLKKY